MSSPQPKDQVYKSGKYEKFIASKSCIVPECYKTPIQKHHVDHSRRNAFMLVPLCVEHHMPGFKDSYHQIERRRFEETHNLDLNWVIMNQLMEFIAKENE